MFKSVIERQRAGRLGTGVWVSAGVHAALLGAVLLISARRPEPEPVCTMAPISLKTHRVELQPQGTPPAAAPPPRAAAQPPRRREVTPPQEVRPLPPEPLKPAEHEPAPALPGTGTLASTGGGGSVGPPEGIGSGVGPTLINPGSTGEDVEPFGQGMTPPVMVGGPAIEYTPQALVAGVQGTLIARCVITLEGQVRDCRVIKGLPHMDAAVMDALEARRYQPVTFQGKAVSVSYVFTVRLKLPR